MTSKLLFFDIDGTLITEGPGVMPESTKLALKKARDNGHLLFINTGRTRTSLPEKITDLNFDGYICGCGINIFLHDKELFSQKLTNTFCKELIYKLREHKVSVLYEASHAVYFDYTLANAEKWIDAAEKLFQIKGENIEDILHSDTLTYDKILAMLPPTPENEELKSYLSQYFQCIDRSNNMYEIIQKGFSKASGIDFLCKYLGKSKEDCYVFGDSENDRAMLEAVPNSIAMGNASQPIKDVCSYVTASVEEDGIYKAMEHFGLI